MSNDLVDPSELTSYPGAPFTQQAVDGAVWALRRRAGWHIAPSKNETVTVDGSDTRLVVLPTLQLTAVSEVRDVSGSAPVVLHNWSAARAGMLRRAAGWPRGFQVVAADITHGYDETPPDLFPVIAAICKLMADDSDVAQESLGAWSTTLRDSLTAEQKETADSYAIPRFA
ncbi:hypothetical protein [Kribbella sp. NPDC051718]|uniref:hypothetical protein n=1 Tax=Kribbella sp. NPDC051718 TaxID=3155168 RepID=UPI003444C546